MRRDINGWGLPIMIILVSFLVLVLLIVVALTYKAYWKDHIDLIDEEYIIKNI